MGMIYIYAIIFVFILIIFTIIIYFVLKKFGYPKLAIIISSILIFIVLNIIFVNSIDETMYFKSDAKEDLKIVNLYLKDDFEIIENKVIGFPERYQKTILKISEADKNRIISEIKNGKYFQECKSERALYYKMIGKDSKKVTANYAIKDTFYKESYEQQKGYVAISEYVTLNENTNNIEINRIED
jgi:energy-coupling factor transporter transmembrane protein EcfT